MWLDSINLYMSLVSTNPANDEVVWEGSISGQKEVKSFVSNACESFESWSRIGLDKRAEILRNFAKIVSDNSSEFSQVISKEMGKPLWESVGEVKGVISKVEITIDAMAKRCSEFEDDRKVKTRYKPHGAIAVFGPFNFPAHLPNGRSMMSSRNAGHCRGWPQHDQH